MSQIAPIVLFLYNRPEHSRRTLQALSENDLADKSDLYIFIDGPKKDATPEQLKKIRETGEIAHSKQWCKHVEVLENSQNKGLAQSIRDGISKILSKHDTVIVLEDDLLTSKGFLTYMNEALELYQAEPKVMHIAGYMLPINTKNLPDTFFFNASTCWGWGTWKEAWSQLNWDLESLKKDLEKKDLISYFNIENSTQHFQQIENNISGKINTWSVRWYAIITLAGGFCLHPSKSLVRNIGLDGSGTHKDENTRLDVVLARNVPVEKMKIEENSLSRKRIASFYKKMTSPSLTSRVKSKIKSILR
jgi:hypothetical protein